MSELIRFSVHNSAIWVMHFLFGGMRMKKRLSLSVLVVCIGILLFGIKALATTDTLGTSGVIYDYSSDGTYAEVIGYEGNETDVIIASMYNGVPVTNIYDRAFYDCDILEAVYLPYGIANVGYLAFYDCDSLKTVQLPSSIISIESMAFDSCKSLKNINIPDNTISIGHYAFNGCSSLLDISIPSKVQNIGYCAFQSCSNLNFKEYENCKYLGNNTNPYHALIEVSNYNCSNYQIHNDTIVIAGYAFYQCSRLNSIIIPNNVLSIGDMAFYQCTALSEVLFGQKVLSIGDSAFAYCSLLTEVTLPNSVEKICNDAFFNCDSIKNVIIGDGVTDIGDHAFALCDNIVSVTIGKNIKKIGREILVFANNLKYVYYKGTPQQWQKVEIGAYNSALNRIIYTPLVVITYNINNGIDAPMQQSADENSTMNITTSIPTREGYKFLGWSKSSTSTIPEYKAGDFIDVGTEDIMLYAVWQRIVATNTSVISGIIMVTPTNALVGDNIIVACYKEKKMVYVDVYSYNGETTVPFVPGTEYDTIKIMVWESLDNLKPLSSVEII